MKRWIWLFAGLLAVAAIAAAEEDTSSAQLVQFAVSMTGNTDQDAALSGFGTAQSSQVGYSSDGNVTQTVSYDNIRNGSITQWGESGDMGYAERWSYLDSVGDAVNVTNWENGKVNQTIYIRNSEKIFLLQKIGGLKKILFPDQQVAPVQNANNWWFCGKSENGSSGLPYCAEQMAKRVFNGKASARDYYMLEVLEDNYDVYPPENLTPRVILKKWNITQADGKITIKFSGHNYGKRAYNATLIVDLISTANVVNLEGQGGSGGVPNWDIKLPERKSIKVGSYTVHSSKDLEQEVVLPLNGTRVNDIQMKLVSG
jgi:hypothetical protein